MRAWIVLLLLGCERTKPPAPAPVPVPVPAPVATPEPPVPDPTWPRLTERGFAGMSTRDMMDLALLAQAFPGMQVAAHAPSQIAMTFGGVQRATIDFDKRADKVILDAPGLVTSHGLAVGQPLARVLDLQAGHRCETLTGVLDSFAKVHVAIRCWVGAKPHFRYVAHPEGVPPRDGAALEAWIRAADPVITTVYWNRVPAEP